MKKTYVYVDGFNLYYGCLKRTAYKWLDIGKLCTFYLPEQYHRIDRIFYFTAAVSGTDENPDAPQRQLKYIRALKTIPNLTIVEGHFIVDRPYLPKADGSGDVQVIRMKEKQSDINMASMLMWHAHCNEFECAVLVTGDSDFFTPIRYVKSYFRRPIGILDPQRDGTPNSPMNKEATFYKPIRANALAASQFPIQMQDAKGTFSKPADWF